MSESYNSSRIIQKKNSFRIIHMESINSTQYNQAERKYIQRNKIGLRHIVLTTKAFIDKA